jgi:hypothetical protein
VSVSPHDGATGRSGLIIPENIPGADLDPAKLEGVASTLRAAGTSALTQAQVAETSWSGLPAVLESPEGPTIYAALGTPSEVAAAIEHKFDKVSDALDDFAAALRPITQTFADIKTDAVAFRATITWDEKVWVSPSETKEYEYNGLAVVSSTSYSTSYSTGSSLDDVVAYLKGRGESVRTRNGRPQILAPWTESSEHIDANNALMDRLADAYTRLQNAEADCANAINRQRTVCVADVEKIEAWQLKQSGENTVVLPWGSRVDEDRNCGESFWWGAGNAGKEALVGAAGLIGYNGVRGDWSWDQAGQSWLGAVQGIGALLVMVTPPLQLLGMAGVPVLKEANTMGQEMVKGLLAWDTWAENPSEAAGRVLVNVGSMFIPGAGEVAAAVKALSAGSRIVDLAGDAARLSEAGLAGLNKLDNLAGALDNLVGDAVGTGAKVDDLVTVGTKIDLPDSDLLHVGSKTDAPPTPGSFLDDGPSAPKPHTDDTPQPARADDSSTPSTRTDDTPGPTTGTGDGDGAGGGHTWGADDTPADGPSGPADEVPGPTDPSTPPDGGTSTPDQIPAEPMSQSDFAQLSASEQMALAKAELGRGAVDFDSESAAIKYGQDGWDGYAENLPAGQAAAVKDYTGAAYQEYNGALRGDRDMTPELQANIDLIDQALNGHPVPEDVMVSRGSGYGHLTDNPLTLVGQVIKDDGYLSTSLGTAAFSYKPAIFHFHVPEGTPGMYVGKVSHLDNAEKELLLGRGLEYEVQRVFLDDNGKWQVFATILRSGT